MPAKNFERTIRFYQFQNQTGQSIWVPLVDVIFITASNSRIFLSLLFDTGASVTTLRADLYPMLGLQSWDQGQRVEIATASGLAIAYQYTATLEIFGKTINCPVHLTQMVPNPFFSGLLGRDTVFREFGFGFWESASELYVTTTP
jgi:hypothetical protein